LFDNVAEKFHIVAIGVSVGGQGALLEFLKQVPPEPNMAFVVVHGSTYSVSEMVSGISSLPTLPIRHGVAIENNHLYVAFDDVFVSIENGRFVTETAHSIDRSIDFFFTALAHEVGERAVGVILSGSGDDGFEGLAEINKYGGKILVQSRSSAPFAAAALPALATDAIHPTLVASPATLALCLTSFAVFNEFDRPSGEYSRGQ
jgi:two-component system CheB/CheR fusion protein